MYKNEPLKTLEELRDKAHQQAVHGLNDNIKERNKAKEEAYQVALYEVSNWMTNLMSR